MPMSDRMRSILSQAPVTGLFVESPDDLEQKKMEMETKRLLFDKARQEISQNEKQPMSAKIRGVTEPQFREDFQLPVGPMTRPQSTALDLVSAERTGIPAPFMNFTPSEYQKVTAGNENLRPKQLPEDKENIWQKHFDQTQNALTERMLKLQGNRTDDAAVRRQQSTVDKFNADPSVRKAQQSIDSAGDIEQMAISGNPIGAAAIPTFMARASGEVGNLSEADKAPFGGSRAILQRINAAAKELANGQLTEDNKNFILDLTSIMKKRGIEKKQTLAKIRSKQYSKIKGLGTEQELYSMFYPDEEVANNDNSASNANPQEKIESPGGWNQSKESRYQELMRKKQQGTLK